MSSRSPGDDRPSRSSELAQPRRGARPPCRRDTTRRQGRSRCRSESAVAGGAQSRRLNRSPAWYPRPVRWRAPSLLPLALPQAAPSRQGRVEAIEPALPKLAIAPNPVVDRPERLGPERIEVPRPIVSVRFWNRVGISSDGRIAVSISRLQFTERKHPHAEATFRPSHYLRACSSHHFFIQRWTLGSL